MKPAQAGRRSERRVYAIEVRRRVDLGEHIAQAGPALEVGRAVAYLLEGVLDLRKVY